MLFQLFVVPLYCKRRRTAMNNKKNEQLGMPYGTANNRLKKSILFNLLKRYNENYCFQCGLEIEKENELSIEHKVPFLDSEDPIKLFFDLDNIAYSHLSCNCSAARQTKEAFHPNIASYKKGCRCDECKEIEKLRRRSQRERGIKT